MKSQGIQPEEAIRIEAYLLSERAGHPPGMDAVFWAQAEAMVHGRVAALVGKAVVPKRPTSKKTPAARKPVAKAQIVKPGALPAVPVEPKAAPARGPAEKLVAPKKPISPAAKPSSKVKSKDKGK